MADATRRGKASWTSERAPAAVLRHIRSRKATLLLAIIAGALILAVGRGALAATSGVPDNTPQTDGVVFSVLPLGNRIYLGGEFTHVDGVPRNHLAAIDATTGELTDWNPGANGKVFSLASSADGTRIYAGGAFTAVGGLTRNRLAAIDATTDAVDLGFKSATDKAVRAIAVSGNRLYIGGDFTAVKGQSRGHLALVDGTTGALDASWTPAADDTVRALATSPDGTRLYAGGRFTSISGHSRLRLAALDPANAGTPLPWRTLVNPNGPIIDLAVSGSRVYAAAGGVAGAAEAYDTDTGARAWQVKGDGDVQAIAVMGGKTYIGGHFLKLAGQDRRFFAAADALTGALDSEWTPSGGGAKLSEVPSTGVWDLAPDGPLGRLYAGTNFSTVSGQPHAGFVQFSASSSVSKLSKRTRQ
jgi:trimeric autotransporter adhesin